MKTFFLTMMLFCLSQFAFAEESDSHQRDSHRDPIYVDDQVYNLDRDAFARVIARDRNGKFVIQFTTGPLAGRTGSGWTRNQLAVLEGCSNSLCVDDGVYNIARNAYAEIVALQYDGRYVLRFTSGDLSGRTGHNWSQSNLATLYGCGNVFCVGDSVYNKARQSFAQVVGVQNNQKYVLRFTSGELSGRTGHNWQDSNLARLEGCYRRLCVGDGVYNIPRNAYATIVGIDLDRKFVIRFTSGELSGRTGHNWSYDNLAPLQEVSEGSIK